jgi:hypothetical protein
MDTIEQRVIEQIELWSDLDEIKLTDDLLSVLSDDYGIEVLQVSIETEFDLEYGSLDDNIGSAKTVSDLVRLVKSRLDGKDVVETIPQKNDEVIIHSSTTEDNKTKEKSFTTNETQNIAKLDCEILIQAATPDIYRINAFRISGLNVNATTREISTQVQKNQMMEKYGEKMDNHKSPFPIEPAPDIDKLRQALHRLRDPETRIIDEFFWFWPHSLDTAVKDHALDVLSTNDIKAAESLWINYEATLTESNVSRHNLAILSHLLVLDIELSGKSLTKDEISSRDKYWSDTFKRWKLLLEHEGFWSRLTARVRQMDDPRLTTGFVNRLREALPYAILQINGIMAVEFAEEGEDEDAKRHLGLIQLSGFDNDVIDRALRTAIDPVRKKIKVFCLSAYDESEKNNLRGIEYGRQVLVQTQNPINILKILLPQKHVIIEGAEDDIIDHVFKCYTKYVNKTEDYAAALELINTIKSYIECDASKAKVDEKIKSIKSVLEYSNFWRLTGYFSYPSTCVDIMEKAFDLQQTLKYDEAISLLRKGLYSLLEIQKSDSLRKQFLHCIAYCLRRQSVEIFNEAFDEYNSEFDKVYNNLVKYPISLLSNIVNSYSSYGSSINCAHCFGSIYGTYYNRTINGRKTPFCSSCNAKIERQLGELETELKKEIKKAFDLIMLSKFLSPSHNPTKIDFEVIKGSADKRNIRSAEISDLLLEFNLLDMSETIKVLTTGSGKKDPKLYSHLISIIESQDTKGRINTFNLLFNSHLALIKEFLPYFFNNETIFNDFGKFVFNSTDKKQVVLDILLREGNYNIWFRLLSIIGTTNEQQNTIESIIKRLVEYIHEIVTNISPDEISFKFGTLGDIIQLASSISGDLKNKCIKAIISAASKDKEKALRIISAIYEDRQAEQVFLQILYSNDPLFDEQMRTQYYEYLLGHWDATIRKKAIEWLNANITDNQIKIKYFIKSLADSDASIQAFANDQITKYPEEAAGLLLVACYTNNPTQLANIRALLKTILSNLNWNSTKAISLSSLFKICLTNKDTEIAQLTFKIIEKAYPDWASSQDVKPCLKNIKYTAKMGHGHNSEIATEIFAKMKTASFGNRLLITFSGSEQLDTPAIPDWCELTIMEREGTSDLNSFIPSGNADDDQFNKLKKYRHKIKPVKINGFSKICYGHHISPDGSVLFLTVFKEKRYAYDFSKEKSNCWDLYSLDLKKGNLIRLFYKEFTGYIDIAMLDNLCYVADSSKNIVGWNWREANDFRFINLLPDKYFTAYPYRLNNDLLVSRYNNKDNSYDYFSLKNNFNKIKFITARNEGFSRPHTSKNYVLIYRRPAKSDGWGDFDAPASYLLVSLNESLSESSRKEVLKESFKNEISSVDFYGDNHIIYEKKTSKDSEKSDIYIQDLNNNKNYQKVISNVNSGFIRSKSGYILYTNYFDSSKSTDLIIHKVSSGESIKLIALSGDGYRDFNISEDWSTFSYLKKTESGNYYDVPCNIYLVNLDMDKNFKEELSINAEDNSYVKIKDSNK